jgi:hypothetical protein
MSDESESSGRPVYWFGPYQIPVYCLTTMPEDEVELRSRGQRVRIVNLGDEAFEGDSVWAKSLNTMS